MAAMLSSSAALAPGARLLNARARKSVGAPRAVPAARVVAAARVHDAETTFACVTDNPAFIVTRSETIGAKQTKQINVRFEPPESGNTGNTVQAVRTAKLLVSSDRVPGAPWAFYLKAAD